MKNLKFKYRPEIDGLRALAVVSVVLYHAEFVINDVTLLKGGFIGVDVFFVISGYLITSIILREIEQNKFSFRSFYERRTRRILPALFTVLATTLPFSWFFLYPKAMKEYAGSFLSSLAFGSNFWFWKEDQYIAEASDFKPLLHTWSLSIEEQFYIFFPIILIVAWKIGGKFILYLFFALFICSLFWAHSTSAIFPETSFFLLPFRGWELLSGCILAKLEFAYGRTKNSFLTKILPALGLLLLCFSFVFFEDGMLHPSFITIVPVLGTCLIIWYCEEHEYVTSILSNHIVIGVGLISYSFYLWHFPILAFVRVQSACYSPLNNQTKF